MFTWHHIGIYGLMSNFYLSKSFHVMTAWTKAKRSAAAKKAALTRKKNKERQSKAKHISKKTPRKKATHQQKSSNKINDSEGQYLKLLKKTFGSNSIVFKTGNAEKSHYKKFSGVPDIATFLKNKITFYEIKPAIPKKNKTEIKDLKSSFLKENQEDWIKENCLKKGKKSLPQVYLVFYKKGRKNVFRYYKKKISRGNLKKYCRSSSDRIKKNTLEAILEQRFSGKYL
jgi:hypothetical protein